MNRAEFMGCVAQQEAKARALATCSEETDFEKIQAEAIKLAETTPLNLLEAWDYINTEVARVGDPLLTILFSDEGDVSLDPSLAGRDDF